jgi:hypothetical protein
MVLVVGTRWSSPGKNAGSRVCLNADALGATEDAALGASSAPRRLRRYFAKPS